MSCKKRYTLYLSRPLARNFDLVAQQRNGAKSVLVEEALRASLEPRQHEGLDDGLARRLNELHKAVARQASDQNVATETLALLVRYFLTVMPPIPESDQESPRLTGRRRFEIFLAEVGRRVADGRRHAAEVLQSVPIDQPDLIIARLLERTAVALELATLDCLSGRRLLCRRRLKNDRSLGRKHLQSAEYSPTHHLGAAARRQSHHD